MIFHYPFKVIPHQSVRVGKGRFYQPDRIKSFGEKIQAHTINQIPEGFKMWPKDIPLWCSLLYTFKGKKKGPKITKPDITDNTQKKLIDSLAGLLFEQDQQIVAFMASKHWADTDSITLIINEYKSMQDAKNILLGK